MLHSLNIPWKRMGHLISPKMAERNLRTAVDTHEQVPLHERPKNPNAGTEPQTQGAHKHTCPWPVNHYSILIFAGVGS